ncbi:unnamed protein product, partial [Laminaria digitata]
MPGFVVFREPKASSEPFQCMFTSTTTTSDSVRNDPPPPRGCEAGSRNKDSTGGGGEWHLSGVPRGWWLNPGKGHYDSLCPEHWAETKKKKRRTLGDSCERTSCPSISSSPDNAHQL